jgi:hypothetical protein
MPADLSDPNPSPFREPAGALATVPVSIVPEPERSEGVPPDEEPLFRQGDLVTVNRGTVNLRTWMSTEAGVRGVLKKGEQAELLSDPTSSCSSIWVKLRPLESDVASYMAARYLELVEARRYGLSDIPVLSRDTLPLTGPYLAGDRFQTTVQARLRAEPGLHGEIVQMVPTSMVGTVLGAPVTNDELDWLPVRLPAGNGWIATRYTKFFGRADKWIEVDLTSQTLMAWDDTVQVSTSPISSGKPGFRTPTGVFTITTKYPARRTVARVSVERWDIPGVPWVMVFREGGFYIHGVYWHNDFGSPVSHGCVTLPVPYAEWLFDWTPSDTRLWIHN